jgi:23S rRNA (cytidine1920-2'-O)/16S rRNA (cytidine1409-2'-O)-methyltransferase
LKKERLDILLVKNGFIETREKAKKVIMSGIVYVNNDKEEKPGTKFDEESKIEIRGSVHPYVSRGGLKIEKAYKEFSFSLNDKHALDIGASTGGFTHFMLLNGVKKVISIDVGYGQLAWKLRVDERVIVKERTNVRYLNVEDIEFLADFASIDVSFISLKKVLPSIWNLLKDGGEIICLIKPQFEAGREKVGKKGVVREKSIHIDVIKDIINYCLLNNWEVNNLTYSPIKGPEGNIEYLLHITKNSVNKKEINEYIELISNIVKKSHNDL